MAKDKFAVLIRHHTCGRFTASQFVSYTGPDSEHWVRIELADDHEEWATGFGCCPPSGWIVTQDGPTYFEVDQDGNLYVGDEVVSSSSSSAVAELAREATLHLEANHA